MYKQLNIIDKYMVRVQGVNSKTINLNSKVQSNNQGVKTVNLTKIRLIFKFIFGFYLMMVSPTKCNSYVYNDSMITDSRITNNPLVIRNNIPNIEVQALQDLYISTNGNKWIWDYPYNNITGFPWNFTALLEDNENPCLKPWQGVYCNSNLNNSDFYILKLHLVYKNLSGTIPSSLDNLVKLKVLDFACNYLVGTIPNSISNLNELQVLDLVYNRLTGSIPETLYKLSKIKILYLGINKLTGTIPNSLGNLNYLELLDIYSNSLVGNIPNSIYNLTQLKFLDFSFNELSGSISNLLGTLTQLEVLYLNNNRLTGIIPSSIERLSNLKILVLNTNVLTGTLDEPFGKFSNLEILSIYENSLSGNLYSSLNNLVNLEFLSICNNLFTGIIPNSLGNLNQLFILDFSYNYFSGEIPSSLSNLTKLDLFSIFSNVISGSITTDVSNMISLSMFIVNDNKLTGNLDSFSNQNSLTTILVQDNQLTGTLPESIFQLKSLQTFVGDNNCFSGMLPMSICDAENIVSIILNGMSSSKSCRQKILPFTSSFILDNSVNGNIPSCIFQLPNLTTLQLAGNEFNGKISIDGDITSTLLNLDLAHNMFSGNIPEMIQQKKWSNLDLSFNHLSGSLIDSFNNSTETLSLENNFLSGKIPKSVRNIKNILILSGNLFSCNLDKSDLPQNDADINNYQCGSNSFNITYYLWIGLFLLSIVIIFRSDILFDLKLGTFECRLNNLILISKRCTMFIIFVLLPFYYISSIFYNTYIYQYVWSTSAAFLSGIIPFVLEFTLFMGLIILLFVSIQNKTEDNTKQKISMKDLKIYFIYITINIIVVISINIVYVYVAIYQTSQLQIFTQIILSFFKIVWNKICTPILLKFISEKTKSDCKYSEMDYSSLQVFMSLFNNIIIPCLVVAIVNPSCFYNVFVNSPEIVSEYEYQICVIDIFTGNCDSYIQSYNTTTYNSPFTYDYQCSSSIITHYIPPFLIMCIINTFVIPVLQLLIQRIYLTSSHSSILFYFSNMIIPKIMKNIDSVDELVNGNQVIISIITYLGLILTFGAVFPLLSISLFISILSLVFFTKYNIKNFINSIEEVNKEKVIEKIEKECNIVGNLPILINSMWILIAFSSLFYTLFLFDILGSTIGFKKSYWIIIVVPLIYVPLYLIKFCFQRDKNMDKEIELDVFNVIL